MKGRFELPEEICLGSATLGAMTGCLAYGLTETFT